MGEPGVVSVRKRAHALGHHSPVGVPSGETARPAQNACRRVRLPFPSTRSTGNSSAVIRAIPTDNREDPCATDLTGSDFHEFSRCMVTPRHGWARILAHEVGSWPITGVLFTEIRLKAAHFISLCVQREYPLVFLVDVTLHGRARGGTGRIANRGKDESRRCPFGPGAEFTILTGGLVRGGYLACWAAVSRPDAMVHVALGADPGINGARN